MQDWVPAVISAASGLIGASVGGAATYFTQHEDRDQRRRGELGVALAELGRSLDAIHRHLDHQPRTTRLSRVTERAINRRNTPALSYLLEWAHAHTIGRDGFVTLERFEAAANRAILLTPETLFAPIDSLTDLLSRADERDQAWATEWRIARGELVAASR